MTILVILLFVLTILAYGCLLATLASLHSSDAAGNGLSQAFGVFLTIGLWTLLASLLVVAAIKGEMPRWTMASAMLLVPASGAAALVAGHMLSDKFYHAKWPLIVPVLLPLPIMAFALWSCLPSLRAVVPAVPAGAFTWGAVLILSLVPVPEVADRLRNGASDRAKAQAEREVGAPQRAEEERQRNLAAFRKLTPASSFSEWMEFRSPTNELREQALAAIRQLPQRQAEIESLLQRGYDYLVDEVQDFDLKPTPVIGEAARRHLKQKVIDLTPRNPAEPPQFKYLVERIEPSLTAIKWLVAHRSGCDGELDAIETAVRLYPDTPERNQFLAAFAAARQTR